MKIKFKLVAAITGISLAVTLILGLVSINISSSTIQSESYGKLNNLTGRYSNQFSAGLTRVQSSVDTMGNDIVSSFDIQKYKENPRAYLKQYLSFIDPVLKYNAENTKGVEGAYFTVNPYLLNEFHEIWYADKTGKGKYERLESSAQTPADMEQNKDDYAYYFTPIAQKKAVWMEPYVDPDIKVYMISYVKPLVKDGFVIGIVGADMSISDIISTIKGLKIYDTGKGMLLNANLDVLISPEIKDVTPLEKMNNGVFAGVMDQIKGKTEGMVISGTGNSQRNFVFSDLMNGWKFAVQVPSGEVLALLNQLKMLLLMSALACCAIAIGTGLYIAQSISRPITIVTQSMNRLSQLDLLPNHELDAVMRMTDEAGIMAAALIKVRTVFSDVILSLREQTGVIAEDSEVLKIRMNTTSEAVYQISLAMDEQAGSASVQAHETSQSTEKLNYLGEKISESVTHADLVGKNMESSKEISIRSSQAIRQLRENFAENRKKTQFAESSIEELLKSSNDIGSIVSVIQGIASQTNMLALNAAIEAARAGESGRGFAVVADEVRKLADQTTLSTNEIEKITNAIQKEIRNVGDHVRDFSQMTEQSERVSSEVSMEFEDFLKTLQTVTDQLASLVINISVMDHEKHGVLEAIRNISAVTEQSSATSEEVAATISEESEQIREVAVLAGHLQNVAALLESKVSQFKV